VQHQQGELTRNLRADVSVWFGADQLSTERMAPECASGSYPAFLARCPLL